MAAVALADLVRAQQDDLRVLRAFVDAVRGIKATSDDVDAQVRRVIRGSALAGPGSDTDDDDAVALLSRSMVAMEALLTRLSATMKRVEELEVASATPAVPRRDGAPRAPAGLLSLRDYAVLQAALEVFFCWRVFPRVDAGVLLPLDRRRPTKTLEISRHVLAWGLDVSRATEPRVVEDLETTGREVVASTRAMLQLLLLPQIQPILLPKYAVEVVAVLVAGETSESLGDTATRQQCQQMRASLLRALPLRLSMASLRGALGQSSTSSGVPSATFAAFKKRCGQLLAQLMMEDGGVQTTIEMLLGAVDEGNTQARMQVATLICQCPTHVQPDVYAASLARQVRTLFDGSNRQNKLLRETAAVLVGEMAARFPAVFDSEFMVPMLQPLLSYENIVDVNATGGSTPTAASETAIAECVALLHLLLCGPPPTKPLVLALVPVFRPLVHLYGFAVASKSLLGPPVEETLIAFIKMAPAAATLLQISVLPVVPPLRPTLAACGPLRAQPIASAVKWDPLYEFCPGGTGGVAMRVAHRRNTLVAESDQDDVSTPLRIVLVGLVQLLASKELESSTVVGDLFSSLLLTYMRVRKSLASDSLPRNETIQEIKANDDVIAQYERLKAPRDGLGLELTLSLLLAIIESLGPSVLRSAETVLQCLTTVLGMFARERSSIVDARDDSVRDLEEEDDDDEVLTVCLGVLMTILEAGASQRSESEEQALREMLPVLEDLSQYPRPQVSELATNARASILSRGASDTHPSKTAAHAEISFEQALRDAAEDLASPLVPLRARGVVMLTKLVRRSQSHRNDAQWTPRIEQLLAVFIVQLADAESYVFLAAVQGLAALADAHPDVAIPMLTASMRDKSHSLEARIKLSEALLFTAKRCGETLPKYAKVLVYSYLECIRPPPRPATTPRKSFSLIQEIDPNDPSSSVPQLSETEREVQVQAANTALAEATLRASCLSNLAEVSAMLQWSLAPFAADVLSCVFGILQLELDMSANSVVAVRRGAVFLLKYVLQLMGHRVLDVLPDQLKPMYHTLKHVERVDRDDVVRAHAQRALEALNGIMRAELFPQVREEDEAVLGGLRSLRIVKH